MVYLILASDIMLGVEFRFKVRFISLQLIVRYGCLGFYRLFKFYHRSMDIREGVQS